MARTKIVAAGMTLPKLFVVLMLIWATAACSVKFAYNNADRFMRWQISDYLDLDADQKAYVEEQIAELMAWHRAEQLPEYAEYMYGLSHSLSDGVTERQIEVIFEQMMAWGDEIEERGMPFMVNLLVSLSDEQVSGLPAKLEESNLEFSEEERGVPLQEVQAQWADKFEDVMERFTGRLQRSQRAYILRRAEAYQAEQVLWAQYRRRWQADVLLLLKKRENVEEFAAGFRRLMQMQESYYGEVFTRISEDNIRLSREVAAYLLSNLTEKQNERFVDSLQELARDFEELSEQV